MGDEDAAQLVSTWGTVRKLWFLALFSATNMWCQLELGIFVPFLYTRVECCGAYNDLPPKYDITDAQMVSRIRDAAAVRGRALKGYPMEPIPACQVPGVPHSSVLWSKSRHCVNPMFVQNQAQRIVGINAPVQKAFTLLILPFGSAFSDSLGRRPVLLSYLFMCVLACAIYLLDSKLYQVWGDTMLIVAGVLICPCWEPKTNVIAACVADLTGQQPRQKSRAMLVAFAFLSAWGLVGYLITYGALSMHLDSYTYLWLVYTALAGALLLLVWTAVPETLPDDSCSNQPMRRRDVFRSLHSTVSVMCRDRLLLCFMINSALTQVHFQGFVTLGVTYSINLGLSAESSILPPILNTACQVIGMIGIALVGSSVKIMHVYLFGSVMFVFAYVAMGPLLPVLGAFGPFVAYACFGFGFAMVLPGMATSISDRVEPEHQGKSQAVVSFCNSIGALVAPLIWNLVLFDATARGFRYLLPAYVSMFLAAVALLLSVLMVLKCDVWPRAKDICKAAHSLPFAGPEEFGRSYKTIGET